MVPTGILGDPLKGINGANSTFDVGFDNFDTIFVHGSLSTKVLDRFVKAVRDAALLSGACLRFGGSGLPIIIDGPPDEKATTYGTSDNQY